MVKNIDTYIATEKARAKETRNNSGKWYTDITKVKPNPDGSRTIYYSERRVILDPSGQPERTGSGAPKRETRKSWNVILVKETA